MDDVCFQVPNLETAVNRYKSASYMGDIKFQAKKMRLN
ncbi:hypothetical protein BMETH_10_3 [methanotrophic bacterial endosymbiont of Bathymodiolus sp.]|nr:hypothetical protein BMETH_10_3 [methanotrophic bacterial endosymbiont of Bathymodiolus sp.]